MGVPAGSIQLALVYTQRRMSSTWVIHFFVFSNLLDFAKSNSGAGFEGFNPKVGSIPANDTAIFQFEVFC